LYLAFVERFHQVKTSMKIPCVANVVNKHFFTCKFSIFFL